MNNKFNIFSSNESLIDTFSEQIKIKLEDAINKKGIATILVSGGNTPKPLFEKLNQLDIPWEKIKVGLVDERWVDENHKDSNGKLVSEYLLKNKAGKASFIPLYQNDIDVSLAQDYCSKLVKEEFFPCDVLILGMGDDAHTASLFPNNENLQEGLESQEYCISMTPKTAPHSRMSLTLSAILKAKNIYLHIQGKNKKLVYDKAMAEDDFLISPISAVLKNDKKQIEVYYNE